MKSKNFAKTLTQFGLILSLLVVTAACGADEYNQKSENRQPVTVESDARGDSYQRSENRQSVRVENGKVEVDCSGSSEGTTSTTTVNGQTYKCENGRVRKVR